jgi:hypothetical protein
VDDFVAVTGLNSCIGPLWTRKDFKVAFNSDTSGGEIQVMQQMGYRRALRGFAALSIDNDCVRRFHLSNSTLSILIAAKFAADVWRLRDWNTLAGTQLETQDGFRWAAGRFDHQGGVRITQARHIEGEMGFSCGGGLRREIGGLTGAGYGYRDFCAGDGVGLRIGDTQLQSDALASEPSFGVKQFDAQRFSGSGVFC